MIIGILIYFVIALITSVVTYLSKDLGDDLESAAIIGLLWFIVIPFHVLKLFTKKIAPIIKELC